MQNYTYMSKNKSNTSVSLHLDKKKSKISKSLWFLNIRTFTRCSIV